MPFVNIRIYEGWGKDNLNEIAKRVTAAITDVTKLPQGSGVGGLRGGRSS